MDGVTAATMRSEGAAPRRAARYGALSLVLVTLLGQGKAGAGGDLRVPQWAVGKLGRGWRGWRGIRVPPRASSYGDRGHWPQLGALEPGLGILHGSPPRSPTASLRESGEGAGGVVAGLGGLGCTLTSTLGCTSRTGCSCGTRRGPQFPAAPSPALEQPETFRPTLDRAVALKASDRSGFQRLCR